MEPLPPLSGGNSDVPPSTDWDVVLLLLIVVGISVVEISAAVVMTEVDHVGVKIIPPVTE